MGKPRVIPDEDHEVVYERVAAVDVAKASGVVCLRTPDPQRPGRFVNRIWDNVPATRARIGELGQELLGHRVQMVTLESTSDYWRIWYYVLESIGLAVQLVSASQAKNLKGRPKTDKLDAMWLARLTQWGMLRPSFVPPAAIRAVRDFTRARQDLVRERTRCLQRVEKLLEDAMIKITSVAADGMKSKSLVAMVQALIAGERDPRTLADLAKGSLRGKRDQLAEALDGMFDSHHGVIAKSLLDQAAFLDRQVTVMEEQAIAALAQVKESWGVDASGEAGPQAGTSPDAPVLAAAHRLAEIPGISLWLAIVIIAEVGLNMTAFPAPAHLVSWVGLCRSATQSGTRHGKGRQKKGNSYARAAAGQAAIGAARTATFLGERYTRIARRRGRAIAQVAVARSIMIIVWHLLSDPRARYRDLGPDFYASCIDRDKKIRNHLRGLQALGLTVTITPDEQAA
ncbi:MAG TPA: IS110 family transposase [Streptosporangiaceae bacterium]|nr:IS110 family transposase [Streptosporangiaceae bacterium]